MWCFGNEGCIQMGVSVTSCHYLLQSWSDMLAGCIGKMPGPGGVVPKSYDVKDWQLISTQPCVLVIICSTRFGVGARGSCKVGLQARR